MSREGLVGNRIFSRGNVVYFWVGINAFYQKASTMGTPAATVEYLVRYRAEYVGRGIPVEMHKGNYPSKELLTKFDLATEYGDIVKACLQGDLAKLEEALLKNQDSFIQSGVFITVERLRMVTLRNFVRRVANAVKQEPQL